MYESGREQRIGSALRRMAEDLVKERRRVIELRRENRRLRADLERLKKAQAPTDVAAELEFQAHDPKRAT
ncbi:MAG TPA: hypothetical protein VG371_00620 [Solirubrobacteraceae bacterium]|nr:hypothetical protein [Solirubrobacteraceae bacterium]